MGFMAGFGEGFSKSYSEGKQRAAIAREGEKDRASALERTKVELDMRAAAKRKDDLAEENRKQAALIKKNQALSSAYNIPEEVAVTWAGQGLDISEMPEAKLKSLKFDRIGADGVDKPSTADLMTQTGNALGAAEPAATPAPGNLETGTTGPVVAGYRIGTQPTNDDEKITSTTSLVVALARAKERGDTTQVAVLSDAVRVQNAIEKSDPKSAQWGTHLVKDRETGKIVSRTLKPEIDIATNKTTYVEFNPDGSVANTYPEGTARSLNPQEQKLHDDILAEASSPQVQELKMKIGEVASLSAIFSQADDLIAKTNGAVLAQKVTTLSEIADSTVKNLVTGIGLFGDKSDLGSKSQAEIDDLEKKIDTAIPGMLGNVTKQAEAGALFKAKIALAVYKAGRLENQDGKDFTSVDMKSFTQILDGSVTQEQFRQNFSSFIANKTNELDSQSQALVQYNAKIDELKSRTSGWAPVDRFAPSVAEYIKDGTSGDAQHGFNIVQQTMEGAATDAPAQAEQQTQETKPNDAPVAAVPAGAVAKLKANPGLAEAFDKKYGPGASASVLGK